MGCIPMLSVRPTGIDPGLRLTGHSSFALVPRIPNAYFASPFSRMRTRTILEDPEALVFPTRIDPDLPIVHFLPMFWVILLVFARDLPGLHPAMVS